MLSCMISASYWWWEGNRAYVIDINGEEAVVKQTANMRARRTFANSVVLPTSDVITIGGQRNPALFSDDRSVLFAEQWSLVTGQWTRLESMKLPRNYHSVALLLQEGRVLAWGGGFCSGPHGPRDSDSPYLFDSETGELAPRPQILSAPGILKPGDVVNVMMRTTVPNATASTDAQNRFSFVLIRHSTVTHSTNNDLRTVALKITSSATSFGLYTLELPSNINVLLGGWYWLFAVDAGVPSVSHDLRVVH